MRLDRDGTRGISDDRHVPAFAQRLDRRHRDADLGPQAGDDQLLAACRLDGVDHLLVLPGVDERAVDHLLIGEHVGHLRKDETAALGDYARQNGGDPENLGSLRQSSRVIDDHLRLVAVQVRELVGLVVDQNEHRIFRTKKRSKTVTKAHYYILCCRFGRHWSLGDMRQGHVAWNEPLPFLCELR